SAMNVLLEKRALPRTWWILTKFRKRKLNERLSNKPRLQNSWPAREFNRHPYPKHRRPPKKSDRRGREVEGQRSQCRGIYSARIPLLGKGGVAAPPIKMSRRHLTWRGRGGSSRYK